MGFQPVTPRMWYRLERDLFFEEKKEKKILISKEAKIYRKISICRGFSRGLEEKLEL